MDESAAVALAAPPPALAAPPLTRARAVASAVAGFALMGLAAGLGSGAIDVALRSAPAGAAAPLGGFVLTGPALIVAHQYLNLDAAPERVLAALAEGFSRAGVVAMGLTPVVLFFSATSNRWDTCFLLGAGTALLLGLLSARDGLWQAEVQASSTPAGVARLLASGWAALTALVTLRLSYDLMLFVLGH